MYRLHESWIFLNGNFYPESQACIPVADRGFLFGEGVFTSIRVHEGKCEFLARHLKRLAEHAAALHLNPPPISLDWIDALIQRNQAMQGTWRLKIILSAKEDRCVGNCLITLHPYAGQPWEPAALCCFPHPMERPLAHVKSLSYLDLLHVREYAKQRSKDNAIIQSSSGWLLETSCANLFWIDQGVCWVPSLDLPYLKGICLGVLLDHLEIPCHFIKAAAEQIPSSANVYLCNALTHVRPVIAIEERSFSRDSRNEALLQAALNRAIEK